MTDIRRTTPIFAALVLLLAACGGGGGGAGNGGTTSAAPTDVGATSGPTQAATSQAPASAAPTDVAPATEPPSGGGGTASDVCGLVTPDELAKIFGVSSVTTTVLAGPPDTCDIQGDGATLAATVFFTANASAVFDTFAADPSSEDVAGIGDRATYFPPSELLIVQKGDSLLSIAVFEYSSDAERLERAKQIGAIAAGRM